MVAIFTFYAGYLLYKLKVTFILNIILSISLLHKYPYITCIY